MSDKPEEQGHMAGHSRVWCVNFGQEYNGMRLRGEERGGWRGEERGGWRGEERGGWREVI